MAFPHESQRVNLTWWQGKDRTITFIVKDSAGTVVDITGWDVWFVMRTGNDAADTEIIDIDTSSSSPASRTVLSDASNGEFQIIITDTDADAFDFSTCIHECGAIKSGGAEIGIFHGESTLIEKVSRG